MIRSRASSVSFSRSQNENDNDNISSDDEDNIQMSLAAPKIQNYLAKASQRNSGFLGRCLPIPFERAAKNSWWDPHFDSEILEGQYKSSAFPQFKLRFRYTLFYTLSICCTWLFYYIFSWALHQSPIPGPFLIIFATLAINNLIFLILIIDTKFLKKNFAIISKIFALVLYGFSLGLRGFGNIEFSDFGYYSICFEVILISYTLLVLPVYFCVIWGLGFSVIFELLGWYLRENITSNYDTNIPEVCGKIFLHICVHLIGIHILVNTNVRQRGTFFKVGQSLLVRKQLELEKQLATKMIHSVMPPKVADTLLNFDNNSQTVNFKSLFRPFNMSRMENVSILFADIVGFTKMSSSKTAEELVEILNDLFERFDHLCYVNNCEKISTLGDCYYCVSGCPEPNQRHAKNCVEMGLGMIQAIKQFDEERNESVNMRVGVHTGVVLCGIVGTKRFKFDVWSNDVTLANKMESTGKPGMVHISEKTEEFLEDIYDLDEGQPVFGYKTYFILGRKSERHFSNQFLAPPHKGGFNKSPKLGPIRPRLLSCNTKNQNSQNFLLPGPVKIKTNSLPNILDQSEEPEENCDDQLEKNNSKKTLSKIKKWKIPKFLINSTKKQENDTVINIEENQGYQQIPEIIEIIEPKSDENFEKNDKIIDVKSYISQSRSDVGNYDYTSTDFQFIRSESCRSPHDVNSIQFDSNNIELSPLSRGRSATMAAKLELPSYEITKNLEIPDNLNLAEVISVNSRKDSGIRSNSRRSSIQQQIFAMNTPLPPEENLLEHRVSGYYTSSQSSINIPQNFAQTFAQTGCTGLQKLRKQSDLQLIKCVQDNFRSKKSYFIKPPLSKFSLFFRDNRIEKSYRKMVFSSPLGNEQISTLAMYNTFFDILVTILIFFLVNFTIFFLWKNNITFLITFGICSLLLSFATLLIIQTIFITSKKRCPSKFFLKKWYPWQIFGALIVALPIITILSITLGSQKTQGNPINLEKKILGDSPFFCEIYTFLFFIGLIHFCNFTQINFWIKNIFCTIFVIIFFVSNFDGMSGFETDYNHMILNMTNSSGSKNELESVYDPPVKNDVNNFELGNNQMIYNGTRVKKMVFFDPSEMKNGDSHASKMSHGDFEASKMTPDNFEASKIVRGNFEASKIIRGDFETSKMSQGDFHLSKRTNGDSRASKIIRGDFEASEMTRSDFGASEIIPGDFEASKMTRSNFEASEMTRDDFEASKMIHNDFGASKMSQGDFDPSNDLQKIDNKKIFPRAQKIIFEITEKTTYTNSNPSKEPPTEATSKMTSSLLKIENSTSDIAPSTLAVNTLKFTDPSPSKMVYNPLNDIDSTKILPRAQEIAFEPEKNIGTISCTPHGSLNPIMLFITLLLLLILIYFINREFEISYRLNFFVNHEANRDKGHVQNMKNQADWLLLNLIPKNVAENLKKNAKYSEKTKNVAIIFASIVNFNEMYEETYNGGKEYLRVLNELIADFDELLTLPKYRSVEKIKTIGSTFMAASGLNPQFRSDDNNEHLYALMDFAIELGHVISNFNLNLLEFNLILRVGYNIGDVVAGVIGTSKLHYDIWGDAVNIASRMDSCGVSGRIQIGENCLEVLEKKYDFEPRGHVYVKGKDLMNVFLLLRKKEEN